MRRLYRPGLLAVAATVSALFVAGGKTWGPKRSEDVGRAGAPPARPL